MEPKATIKNKVTGLPYEVTRSQWETIRNSGMGADYEMVKDFPPLISLADLPEVKALNDPPPDPITPPAEPGEELPNDPPADEQTGKAGKKRSGKG